MAAEFPEYEVIDDATAAYWREKTPAERLKAADALWVFARIMVRALVIAEHPNLSEQQTNERVAERMLNGEISAYFTKLPAKRASL